MTASSAQETFDAIVARYAGRADVSVGGTMMRATGMLKVSGKIAAMLVDGALVVKLPAQQVTSAVQAGDGAHFATKPGRPMKEWLTIPYRPEPVDARRWADLVESAVAFAVANRSR